MVYETYSIGIIKEKNSFAYFNYEKNVWKYIETIIEKWILTTIITEKQFKILLITILIMWPVHLPF